jgi:hypothetical protein
VVCHHALRKIHNARRIGEKKHFSAMDRNISKQNATKEITMEAAFPTELLTTGWEMVRLSGRRLLENAEALSETKLQATGRNGHQRFRKPPNEER